MLLAGRRSGHVDGSGIASWKVHRATCGPWRRVDLPDVGRALHARPGATRIRRARSVESATMRCPSSLSISFAPACR
jgi:hypothetical protein